jgi:hypothetical protein
MAARKLLLSVCFAGLSLAAYSQNNTPDTANLFPNDMIDGQKVYARTKPMPEFSGDMYQLLSDSLSYPPSAGKWKGTVYATLVVDTNGNVRVPQIIKISSPDKQLPKVVENELIGLLLRMGKWRPGKAGGKVAPVRIFLPGVTFEPPDGQ